MAATIWLSWQDDVSLSTSDGEAIVDAPGARVAVKSFAPEIFAALERLAPPGEQEQRLADSVLAAGSIDSLARWHYHVDQFCQRGLIRRSLFGDDGPLATLVPLGISAGHSCDATRDRRSSVSGTSNGGPSRDACRHVIPPRQSVLSRFAYLRREGDVMVLESPLARCRLILHDSRVVSIVAELSVPRTPAELADRVRGLDPGDVARILDLLAEARMVEPSAVLATDGREADCRSERELSLESWEFHDLLFHTRSRRGRSDGRFGGTYRLEHQPAPPAMKPIENAEWHDLHRPDMERLEREDPPLAFVQNKRQSIRKYGSPAMTSRQLGEFLYRVGRVTRYWESEAHAPAGPLAMDFTSRPYPAGGGLYELEFYVAVGACQELETGLYHYDPQSHRLARSCPANRNVGLLICDAAASAGIAAQTLQVLVILAARFRRLAWKYESIAYSLILKDVGVLYQTMYLAATAMGLAPCALGCGDSDLFAQAAGTDYYVEASVGEFLLGSKE